MLWVGSSLEVIIKDREEVEQGQFEDIDKIVYLDYTQFDDLAEAIKTIKDIENNEPHKSKNNI